MTDSISIQLDQESSEFLPGATISGKVIWTAAAATKKVELRLFWFTEGRGTQDIELAEERSWDAQGQAEQAFELTLPLEPYSFSGTLISLQWALEAVTLPKENATAKEIFTLSPNGKELILSTVENSLTANKKTWGKKR
ncbi:MAG: hypothetical protein ABGY95_12895 [Rubritalea sp.]|uniref:hypothetical protein n=1 Tax=Rubritalea sp. TaxID=2109375 RepID=UPI0032428010